MKTITKTLPTGITTVQNKSKNGAITITIADEKSTPELNKVSKVFISVMYWIFVPTSMSLLFHILSSLSVTQLVLLSPIWLFIGALYTVSFIQYYHTIKN